MADSKTCGLCGVAVPASGPGLWLDVPCRVGISCDACHERVKQALTEIVEAAKLLPVELVESAAEQMRDRAAFTPR